MARTLAKASNVERKATAAAARKKHKKNADNDKGNDEQIALEANEDAQLLLALRKLGANVGPINDSTRALYRRRLEKMMKEKGIKTLEHIPESNEEEEKPVEKSKNRRGARPRMNTADSDEGTKDKKNVPIVVKKQMEKSSLQSNEEKKGEKAMESTTSKRNARCRKNTVDSEEETQVDEPNPVQRKMKKVGDCGGTRSERKMNYKKVSFVRVDERVEELSDEEEGSGEDAPALRSVKKKRERSIQILAVRTKRTAKEKKVPEDGKANVTVVIEEEEEEESKEKSETRTVEDTKENKEEEVNDEEDIVDVVDSPIVLRRQSRRNIVSDKKVEKEEEQESQEEERAKDMMVVDEEEDEIGVIVSEEETKDGKWRESSIGMRRESRRVTDGFNREEEEGEDNENQEENESKYEEDEKIDHIASETEADDGYRMEDVEESEIEEEESERVEEESRRVEEESRRVEEESRREEEESEREEESRREEDSPPRSIIFRHILTVDTPQETRYRRSHIHRITDTTKGKEEEKEEEDKRKTIDMFNRKPRPSNRCTLNIIRGRTSIDGTDKDEMEITPLPVMRNVLKILEEAEDMDITSEFTAGGQEKEKDMVNVDPPRGVIFRDLSRPLFEFLDDSDDMELSNTPQEGPTTVLALMRPMDPPSLNGHGLLVDTPRSSRTKKGREEKESCRVGERGSERNSRSNVSRLVFPLEDTHDNGGYVDTSKDGVGRDGGTRFNYMNNSILFGKTFTVKESTRMEKTPTRVTRNIVRSPSRSPAKDINGTYAIPQSSSRLNPVKRPLVPTPTRLRVPPKPMIRRIMGTTVSSNVSALSSIPSSSVSVLPPVPAPRRFAPTAEHKEHTKSVAKKELVDVGERTEEVSPASIFLTQPRLRENKEKERVYTPVDRMNIEKLISLREKIRGMKKEGQSTAKVELEARLLVEDSPHLMEFFY